ncbi:hypothetical protein ACS0TY_030568 [Phlomoides rotata]
MEHREVAHVVAQPSIQFSPKEAVDIQGFHNDALFITTDIEGFDVARIFVDTESSCDIIFLECFKKMDLNVKLKLVEITLYGFAIGSTQPLGQMKLPVRDEVWEVKGVQYREVSTNPGDVTLIL